MNDKYVDIGTVKSLTLIARVHIDATTSREPPRTWLPGKSGSYSHMAVAFSMATILVIWPMTATFAMLTTCLKQLYKNGVSVYER